MEKELASFTEDWRGDWKTKFSLHGACDGLYDASDDLASPIPDVAPDDTATLQPRAWYNGNGAYPSYNEALNSGQPTAQSTTASEPIGGDIFFPPDLPGPGNFEVIGGITSFSLVIPSGASNLIDVAFTSAGLDTRSPAGISPARAAAPAALENRFSVRLFRSASHAADGGSEWWKRIGRVVV
jgi:hypothetical protein